MMMENMTRPATAPLLLRNRRQTSLNWLCFLNDLEPRFDGGDAFHDPYPFVLAYLARIRGSIQA